MKNKLQAVLLLCAVLLLGLYGSLSAPKALAQVGANCWQPSGQKVSDGNGPSAADEGYDPTTGHCNSYVNIDYATRSGNTLYVQGEVFGGGITSSCVPPAGTDSIYYISEADGVAPYQNDFRNTTNVGSLNGYDAKGNTLTFDDVSVQTLAATGSDCTGPIDLDQGGGGAQEYDTFSYHIDMTGFTNGVPFTTYVHIVPSFNGTYQHNGQNVPYSDNYTQYTYQQCASMGWSTKEDCRDYWSYFTYTPTGLPPTTGTIKVTADRSASWKVYGNCTGTCTATNATSGTYSGQNPGTYTLEDPSGNSLGASGFSVDNSGTALNNPSSIFARIINTAEASSCAGYTCALSAGGTVAWNLHSSYCSLTVQSQVNGTNQALSGLNYTVNGGSGSPQTITSTPQTIQMPADPNSGSNFTATVTTEPSSWNSYSIDDNTTAPSATCLGGNTATITMKYLTRAKLNVQ